MNGRRSLPESPYDRVVEEALQPPVGTIALLFTDIEGSTRLARALGPAWPGVLDDHHALVGGAIAAEGGYVDRTEGDAFVATFTEAAAGARAAVRAQRAVRAHGWPPEVGQLGVRMGLHVGYVERHSTGYVGLEVHRAARVAAAAHGGQLLITATARDLIGNALTSEPLGAHRLKDFPAPEPLFCAVIDGRGAAAFPPIRTQAVRPNNLPAGGPRLVGREADLARVRGALLDDGERLVTIIGRGGAGKTSLALAAASTLLDDYAGGVWLARLANVVSADQMLPTVATAVGADRDAVRPPLEAIADRLRERGATLVVLDNMEHLLAAVSHVAALLDAVPDLCVLVTSQAPLHVATECCLPLDALDDEAALTLIERVARRQGATTSGATADRAALLDVVRLLDGLPLALELAAVRLSILTPAQLRDRLRDSPDLLKDTRPGRLERHRSLRATVEWTLELLDEAPRALFTRLGAFAGPVELEELEAVAGADALNVLESLAGLLDVALVHRVESGDDRMRFGLPEALRRIASGMLDAAPDGRTWRKAHAERQCAIAWAARALSASAGADYRAAVAADAEAAAALRWARGAADPLAAPLGAARAALLADKGRTADALAVLEPLLAAPSGDPVVDGQARFAYAHALCNAGRLREAATAADQVLTITSNPAIQARALVARAWVHSQMNEHEAAVRVSEHATALARPLGPALHSGVLMMEAQARLFGPVVQRQAPEDGYVPTVTHLHGGHNRLDSDGLPDVWFTQHNAETGRLFNPVYTYDNDQQSATLWYHDHALGITRLNVYAGLASFYLLQDQNEDGLVRNGVLPDGRASLAAIQDRAFTGADDKAVDPTILPECFGDFMLVNGMAWLKMDVQPTTYRFHLLNGLDSRFETAAAQMPSSAKPPESNCPT